VDFADRKELPGRRRPRSETREALLDAARHLIRSGEVLTTVGVTRAVGVTQPAFYAHFRNVEECEREVLREVAGRLRRMHTEQRRNLLATAPLDVAANAEVIENSIRDWLDNSALFEIAQRRRYDSSPLGDLVRDVDVSFREELAADIRALITERGFVGDADAVALLRAELTIASVAAAVDSLLSGRQKDLRLVAHTLAMVFVGSLRSILAQTGPTIGPSREKTPPHSG
jgi:AcrR family transcriptional regulator